MERPYRQFFDTGFGSPTADDWRTFAEAFGPLCFLELWALYGKDSYRQTRRKHDPNLKMDQDHLDIVMTLCEIVHLLFRPTISERQISMAESKIASLIKSSIQLHSGLHNTWNLHWLSHIPQDIRNYGPVYSFWCFTGERFNKTLKNINHNGHIRQLPGTIMTGFQQYSHLRELSTFGQVSSLGTDDAVNQTAAALSAVYAQWIQAGDGTKEQHWAALWEEDRRQREEDEQESCEHDHVKPKTFHGRNTSLGRLETFCLFNHLQITGPTSGNRDQADADIQENEPTTGMDVKRTWVVGCRIVQYQSLRIGRSRFTSFIEEIKNDELAPESLSSTRDCFVELRSPQQIYDVNTTRCQVGLITRIFRHTVTTIDQHSERSLLYIVIRYLRPYFYVDEDPYGFYK